MPTPPESEKPAPLSEQDTQPVDLSRRKLGMGLGMSAVFTLASRPVLAAQCMSPSAAASGNLSTHGTPPQCTGLSPLALVQANAGKDVTFHVPNSNNNKNGNGVFVSGARADWGGKSLYQVMADSGSGNTGKTPNPISKEFAATLLNIRDGRIPFNVLNEVGLIGMWHEWMDTGAFAPKAGASWGAEQIVTYLRSLQGA